MWQHFWLFYIRGVQQGGSRNHWDSNAEPRVAYQLHHRGMAATAMKANVPWHAVCRTVVCTRRFSSTSWAKFTLPLITRRYVLMFAFMLHILRDMTSVLNETVFLLVLVLNNHLSWHRSTCQRMRYVPTWSTLSLTRRAYTGSLVYHAWFLLTVVPVLYFVVAVPHDCVLFSTEKMEVEASKLLFTMRNVTQ